jgi:hypothetical protein
MTMTTTEFHRGHDDPRAHGALPPACPLCGKAMLVRGESRICSGMKNGEHLHFRTTFTNTKPTTSPCPKNN